MNKLKYILVFVLVLLLATSAFATPRWWNCTSLIGGAEGSLDSINGQNLFDGYRAIVTTTTQVYFYYLDDDSGAGESSPGTISPDLNAGDKRWILIQSIVP